MTSSFWNFGGLAHDAIKAAWSELPAKLHNAAARETARIELGELLAPATGFEFVGEMVRKFSISSLLTLAGLGTTAVVQAQVGCPDFTDFSMVCAT